MKEIFQQSDGMQARAALLVHLIAEIYNMVLNYGEDKFSKELQGISTADCSIPACGVHYAEKLEVQL